MLSIQIIIIFFVAYGTAGSFYGKAAASLAQLKTTLSRNVLIEWKHRIYAKKILISWQTPRIKLMVSNTNENTTTFEFELFCMERVIDLLLTG